MADEANVRVRLDTKQAKADLSGLAKEGEATAEQMGAGARGGAGSMIGSRLGMVGGGGGGGGGGFGGIVGSAKSQARGLFSGGISSVLGEATAGLRADADALVGGPKARANTRALEDMINTFGSTAALTGITKDMRNRRQQVRDLMLREEKGASMIRREFGGEGIKEAVQQVKSSIVDGMQELGDILKTWSGR